MLKVEKSKLNAVPIGVSSFFAKQGEWQNGQKARHLYNWNILLDTEASSVLKAFR